mgnify:CR=1 FL=1
MTELSAGHIKYSNSAYAVDLGVEGTVFEVVEEDLLEYLSRTLAEYDKNGKLAEMQQQWLDKTQENIKRPRPSLENIKKTEEYKVRYFNQIGRAHV